MRALKKLRKMGCLRTESTGGVKPQRVVLVAGSWCDGYDHFSEMAEPLRMHGELGGQNMCIELDEDQWV